MSKGNRLHRIDQLIANDFDLVIIGGGITGLGIGLDAVTRGLSVALIDKNDIAYGTSSRSTKLIHGGLRYLKQLEFGLVKEVGSERAILHRLAPHLVIPEKMLIPIFENRGLGFFLTYIGLSIYDLLAGVKSGDKRQMLSRSKTLHAEPLLKPDGVKGGARYAEYRTDDARLTLSIARTAMDAGLIALNHCHAEAFTYNAEGKIDGVMAKATPEARTFRIKAKRVVNAGGPWVDEIRKFDSDSLTKQIILSKGVHIVVPHVRLPIQQAIYFDTEDGRMIFAIPRDRNTYIGTTDTLFNESPDTVFTTQADAEYLLRATNNLFPSVQLVMADVTSSWAGLRPLIREEGKDTSAVSRRDEIFESESGLISIAGGKLTGYRKMAERVVNLVFKSLGKKDVQSKTRTLSLCQNAFQSWKEVVKYLTTVESRIKASGGDGLDSYYLVTTYGVDTDQILDMVGSTYSLEQRIAAEARFTIKIEMATTLVDFFVRRTGMLYFNPELIKDHIEVVLEIFRLAFEWDEARIQKELDELTKVIETAKIKIPLHE